MSGGSFTQGILRPAFLVGGSILSALSLYCLVCAVWVLFCALLGMAPGIENFNEPAVATAVYLVIATASGGYGLALLKGSKVEFVNQLPIIGEMPGWSLVVIASIAAIPILLFIALMISIIASGGLD